MADKERKRKRKSHRRAVLDLYFFLDGDLHKKIRVNRGQDLLVTWNYTKHQKATHNYSTVIRRHQKAFDTKEVCEMVNRKFYTVFLTIANGHIRTPQYTYALDGKKQKHMYMWSEENILELHEYLCSVHRGRPRKDGKITNTDLPTAREIRAMIHGSNVLYVKQGDEFVPAWRAKDF